jgi:hydrogenase maturation protease
MMGGIRQTLQSPCIRVIGVGNALRGDDAVGLMVARYVRQEPMPHVAVLEARGDGTSLLQDWQGADMVIIIDAVHADAVPGTVYRLEPLRQPLPQKFFSCSTHAFGVAEAIALARALRQLPAHLIVYGITGKTFGVGDGLSAEVAQAVPRVVAYVQDDLRAFQQTPG